MGNKRQQMRRKEREDKLLDKPYTTTRREVQRFAQQQIEKYYEEYKEELSREIRESLSTAVGYLVASALEQEYGFKKKRCSKAVIRIMQLLMDMAEDRVSIVDHIDYWKEEGMEIVEDGNNLTVRVFNKGEGENG